MLTALIVSNARAASAQPPANAVTHRPWLEATVGGAANSHERLNRPPLCVDRSFPCLPEQGPARAGLIDVAGYPTQRFGIVGSIDAESHLVSVIGPAQREEVNYFFAGGRVGTPLTNGPSPRTLRFFGDAMAGVGHRSIVQRTDRLTSGLGAMVGAGVDWRLCKGLGACFIRGELSYRKFEASAQDLDGWRTAVGMGLRLGNEPQAAVTPSFTSRRFDISGGITMQTPPDVNLPPLCQSLTLPCGSPRTFPDLGIAVSPALHLNELVSVSGEVNAFANLWHPAAAQRAQTNRVRTTLAGLRLHSRPISFNNGRFSTMRLFGQLLGGEQWATEVPSRRAVQPGFGIDISNDQGVSVRVQFDHTSVPGPGRNLSGERVLFGLVYGR